MLTIIESSSKAWALAATNGDLRVYCREQPGDWVEILLSDDCEQIDEDGSLLLEALYEERVGHEAEPDTQGEKEPEAEEGEELEADEEEEPEANEEEEPEANEGEEPEAEEELPEEQEEKPRSRSRGRARVGKK